MTFDNAIRTRLKALADREPLPELEAPARARIERNAVQLLERAETQRSRVLAFVALSSLCVAGFLLFQLPLSEEAASIYDQGPVQAKSMTSAERASPACAEHPGSGWQLGVDGRQELDLGTRALLVATGSARIAHVLSERCDVQAELADGSVAVHARDLRGGRLVVRTPRGDVTVKGTIFEVTFDAGKNRLRVAVDEGLVEVETKAGERFEVGPGSSLSLGADVVREALVRTARDGLRRRLDVPTAAPAMHPKTEPAAVSNEAVPAAKEVEVADEARAWHAGSVQKPELPPQPGTSVTDEGRPMQKPHVIVPRTEKERDAP